MISIIIPSKNEEAYLPLLLNSIKKQNISDLEVIVADANSIDKTRKIAREYGCKVIEGGSPARGRNNGARYSKNSLLFFLDADTKLPENFLKSALKKFYSKQLDGAGFFVKPFSLSQKPGLLEKSFYLYGNLFSYLSNYFKPLCHPCILTKKEIHEKVGGFDESLIFGEDSEYLLRIKTLKGKVSIFPQPFVYISSRRFEKENKTKLAAKYLTFNVLRSLGKEFRKQGKFLRYEFDYKRNEK